MSTIRTINPLQDHRWTASVQTHPRASVFHTSQWLNALHSCYGYEPVVLTASANEDESRNGMVFCSIRSWLTGRRLVCLPFADHCQPLVESDRELTEIVDQLKGYVLDNRCQYLECRPLDASGLMECGFRESSRFYLHTLDLRPEISEIVRRFHKSCVVQRAARAQRAGVTYESGRSELFLKKFYHLMCLTRRKHLVPAQPLEWFKHLVASFGDSAEIHLGCKDGDPVAAILTLRHRNTTVVKYNCSDPAQQNLGGTQLVLWKAIERAKNSGITEVDFGRTDRDNQGLATFKERWGAKRSDLVYVSYPEGRSSDGKSWQMAAAKRVFAHMPDGLQRIAGRLLYKHIG